ncbi:MAG: hypothetical protein IJP03_05390 [Christensenellaceae bacterium]|nr:hypothetical protein [Christensenellaceae bacterium]
MKKILSLLLTVLLLAGLSGCGKSLNAVIKDEPSISGVILEVRDDHILIYIQNAGYPSGAECTVSLHTELADGLYSPMAVGDEVTVYFDGDIAESYPMQIHNVYAITLTEPADRAVNAAS